MNTLRKWLRRAVWYCFFALIVNFLIAASILFLPVEAFFQHILAATFSTILLSVAVVILVQALDSAGLLFEASARARRVGMRIVYFLVSIVLVLLCIVLVGLLILRLHQSFGDFLLGSDAVLMQVEILVIGALAWRQARLLRIEQQKKL